MAAKVKTEFKQKWIIENAKTQIAALMLATIDFATSTTIALV